MNELEDILNYLETTSLEPHDDYTSEFSYKKQKILWSYIKELQRENQELKRQLENCWCNRTDCSARIKDSKQYDSLAQKTEKQQKEFIEWLEKMSKNLFEDGEYGISATYGFISSIYKEIIGDKE